MRRTVSRGDVRHAEWSDDPPLPAPDEFPLGPPPRPVRNIICDLAEYQTQPAPQRNTHPTEEPAMLIDHIPHLPTPEELAAAPTADVTQEHDRFEAEHPALIDALYEMATRCAETAR